ncbi:hypothetical protein [Motilibacter peucedani]|uniref:hypothetical protein n=1 Tax=Motilibacter peucedani TaxID=598650 RepID=UPI001E4E47E4|nr:hypothetical protein [Motilibacter peucedani]
MGVEELGAALRSWRARVRRDEVTFLVGVSVEYVVKLEQGRAAPLAAGRRGARPRPAALRR